MAAIRIAGAHNPVNKIEFAVELPGEELLEFCVPKYEYIPKPVLDKYEPWFREWNDKALATDEAGAEERANLRDTDAILKLLELLLPKTVYTKLAKLTRGELMAIDQHWTKGSGVTLGESVASDAS